MTESSRGEVIAEHLSNVEAMIDFYFHAFESGSPTFDAATAVLQMLMRECRTSLYAAMKEVEARQAEDLEAA